MIATIIEQMIVKKLGLYSGIRSTKTDNDLHHEAYDRVFLETLSFLNENNPNPPQQDQSTIPSQDIQEKFTQLLIRLNSIPDWEDKLLIRINYYLDNWVISGK